MAPKKNEPPPPPPEDTNPFGVLVSITIPSATLIWDVPADAPQDPASLRKTHITLNIPGCHVPWASTPTAASEDSVYQYTVVKHFRRSGAQDGLLQLINGVVTVTINDSTTNAVLASATLDQMWGFAIGQNTWSADDQDLTPAAEAPAGVPKLRSARLSFISIALQERQLPPGADAAALAAAPPPESELPPLLPYSYVTQEFAEKGNMVELVVHDISPLPPTLQAVNDAAGGKLGISVGVRLPGGGPTVVVSHVPLAGPATHGSQGGAGGRLAGPVLRREQLSAEACTALQYHLEDGLPLVLEVARYIAADTLHDPAWEAYHAAAPGLELFRCLTGAGVTSGSTEEGEGLPLQSFAAASSNAAGDVRTCLPPYTPPASKSKAAEEPPPAGTCFWERCGARLAVSFRLARPLIPPWQPPPPPPRSLLEMIPPRDLTPKPPPITAADEFKAKVRSIARALAEEYKAVLPPAPSAASPGAGGGPASGEGSTPEARHKALVFELNRSGKYAQMRDSLKASVVALVREKYRKSGSMSPNEMALLYNDLYGTLLAATHSALNGLIDAAAARPRAPLPEPVPDKARLGQLLELAAQAEAVGDTTRAESLHQRRLLAKNDPQVWYEYGTYCLRRGARGRAEQCFREALSLAPAHRAALLALLGCSVAEGRATDPAYLEAAEAAAHRLMEVEREVQEEAAAVEQEAAGGGGAAAAAGVPPPMTPMELWAVMSLVYRAFGDSKRTEQISCEQEMTRLEQEAVLQAVSAAAAADGTAEEEEAVAGGGGAAERGIRPSQGSVSGSGGVEGGEGPVLGELQARAFISLATTLLDTLSLPSEALLALELAASLRHWPAVGPDTRSQHLLTTCLARQALGQGLEQEPDSPGSSASAGAVGIGAGAARTPKSSESGAAAAAAAGGTFSGAAAAAASGAGTVAPVSGPPLMVAGGPVYQLMRGGGVAGWRAKLLAAQALRMQGRINEAVRFYQEYIEAARDQGLLASLPLPVWLQLAACYTARGQPRHAADVYLLGASVAPGCAVLWRGAGECFAAAGDLSSADMCLSEANVLDPEDALAWGWLALVALREGRQEDAEKALSFGLRCGLDEPRVLLDIAEEYGGAGQLRQQQRVLQELALKLMPESCGMRLRLARCLLAQRMGPEAAAEVVAARGLAGTEEDEAAVAELEAALRGMTA